MQTVCCRRTMSARSSTCGDLFSRTLSRCSAIDIGCARSSPATWGLPCAKPGSGPLDADTRRGERLAELRDLGADLVQLVRVVGDREHLVDPRGDRLHVLLFHAAR